MATDGTGVRPHLGVGWPFPVRPASGALSYVAYEAKVEQSISVILETAKRERVMLPAFGAGLRSFVFESNSVQTARSVETAVRDALVTYEPRITVENVRAQASPDDPNLLLIEIDYVVRATSSFFNLVYPFYLTQRT